MKRLSVLLLPFALLGALAGPARASDFGVTIAVSQPGLHGQVRISPRHTGHAVVWQPVVLYEARPVPHYDPYWQPAPPPAYRHGHSRRHAWRHAQPRWHHHGHHRTHHHRERGHSSWHP